MLLYFFNFLGLSSLIASEENRELGILEHLQLILILIIFVIAVRAIKTKDNKIEKYIFIFISAFTLFFFLEEIDYGLHYLEWFSDNPPKPEIRNIHNNGSITSVFKMTAYVVIVVFFVILPFLPKRIKLRFPFLEYISPSKQVITTTICLFLINELAFYLNRQEFHSNRSLDGNTSEFEEFMTYYLVMLYVWEMSGSSKVFYNPYVATHSE
jgi:uncharacterized membrane protein YozB (DUF420 family)